MKRKQERSAQNSASPDPRKGEGMAMANVGALCGKETAAALVAFKLVLSPLDTACRGWGMNCAEAPCGQKY